MEISKFFVILKYRSEKFVSCYDNYVDDIFNNIHSTTVFCKSNRWTILGIKINNPSCINLAFLSIIKTKVNEKY